MDLNADPKHWIKHTGTSFHLDRALLTIQKQKINHLSHEALRCRANISAGWCSTSLMTVLVNWPRAVHGLLPRGSVPLEQSINSNSAKCEEKKRNLDLSPVYCVPVYTGTVLITTKVNFPKNTCTQFLLK